MVRMWMMVILVFNRLSYLSITMAPRKSTQKDLVPMLDTTPRPSTTSPPLSSPSINSTPSFPERLVPIPLSSLNLPALDSSRPLPNIHINKANLVELKNACDDAVKTVSVSLHLNSITPHPYSFAFVPW
jgi:hypothetical protein